MFRENYNPEIRMTSGTPRRGHNSYISPEPDMHHRVLDDWSVLHDWSILFFLPYQHCKTIFRVCNLATASVFGQGWEYSRPQMIPECAKLCSQEVSAKSPGIIPQK